MSVNVKMYLFVVQQALSGRKAEIRGVELGVLAVVVELKTVGV